MSHNWVVAFFAMAVNLCCGQEESRTEGIFRYLPEGYYSSIAHTNFYNIQKTAKLDEYNILIGQNITKGFPFLEGYNAEIESVTAATILKIQPDSLADSSFDIAEINEEESLSHGRNELIVIEINNLAEIIKQITSEGILRRRGKFKGTAVYSTKIPVSNKKEYFLACLDTEGYLLITDNLNALRGMLNAGSGQALGFLDGEDYQDLVSVLTDLGQYWSIRFIRTSGRIWLHTYLKRDRSERIIEKLRERVERAPLLRIKTIYFDDEILEREYAVFANHVAAGDAGPEEVFNMGNSLLKNKDMTEQLKYIDSKRKFRREGNCLISEIEINEEYIKNKIEYDNRMVEYYEKLRAEREEEKEIPK